MKTNNRHIKVRQYFLYVFLSFISFGLISCEEEPEEQMADYELIIPSNACSFDIASVDNGDETIVYAKPSFTNNFEILGCSVNKVAYYIDNVLVSTEMVSPFHLEYKTNLLLKGQHILKAVFTVGGEGFKEATAEYLKEFTVGGSSLVRPAVKFNFEYNHCLRVGDKVQVSLNMIDRYNAGYKIRKVTYRFDNNLISTKTDAPYDFEYSPTLVVGQKHTLQVDISYILGSSSLGSYGLTATIPVIADDETWYLFSSDYFDNTNFSNGEILSGTGLLYRGVGDDIVYELNLYWDDELVGTSRTFPYKFSYVVENASIGIHKMKQEWKKYDKDGKNKGSQWETKTIIIDK